MDRSPATVLIWLVAAALAVLVGVRVTGCGGSGGGDAVRIDGAEVAPSAARGAERPARATVIVHVAGAVRAPGLYRVAPTARVAAALARAGGPVPRADLDALNLAARVQDGQQIVVPRRGGGGAGVAAGAGAKPSLGSATVEQLEQLEGIGPTLAERIVAYRTAHGGFRSVDELAEVDGIGEQRLEALREALQP